jgi:8-oxo-dGTP pyrophosphatase MutT (NUDIX family)
MRDEHHDELQRVVHALAGPRPGLNAHRWMAPRPRPIERILDPPADCRWAAVLVLLYPVQGQLTLVLTRRADTLPDHRGQISFPGGVKEPGESFQQAALREACEELGVDPARVRLLGQLSDLYIPPTNFCVRPSVGATDERPPFHPAPDEVAEVIEVPVIHFLAPECRQEEEWIIRGEAAQVPFFRVGEHIVWGATAMILGELVLMLHEVRDRSAENASPHVPSGGAAGLPPGADRR